MAQTKIKAGLFEGIIGNGTDGYFLMSNGDGTMTWAPSITPPTITSIAYPGSVTAADPDGGETITVTGADFNPGFSVTVGGTAASIVSYVSSTQINFTTPAKAAGDYDIVVTNSDGGTATFVNGISYNGVPAWTTPTGSLGSFASDTTISTITLQAAEPDAGTITFSITNGALPTGLSLTGANIDGTTSIVSADTTYNFTVTATDDESQSTGRAFSITIEKYVLVSSEHFTINTYTGTGSSRSIEGKIGTAASFNGSSSYITTPSIIPTNNFSFSFWVNMSSFSGAGTNQVVFVQNENNNRWYIAVYESGRIEAWSGLGTFTTSSSVINLNQWHNVVYTASSSTGKKIYVDGTEVLSNADTSNNGGTAAGNLFIGFGKWYANSLYLDGKLDQTRIFNKVLTTSEIATLYGENNASSTKSKADIFNDGSSIAFYEFEEGAKSSGAAKHYLHVGDAGGQNTSVRINSVDSEFTYARPTGYAEWGGSFDPNNTATDYVGSSSGFVFSESNKKWDKPTSNYFHSVWSTNSYSSGKYYVELEFLNADLIFGLSTSETADTVHSGASFYDNAISYFSYSATKRIYSSTSVSGGAVLSTDNVIGFAIDFDNKTLKYYINNTLVETETLAGYDGTSTNVDYVGTSFKPGLVWTKSRSNALNHALFDSVRGTTKALRPNDTTAEQTRSGVTSFNSNGFTIGSDDESGGQNGYTYVSWCWKAGNSVVTDSATGTLTADISANTNAGFSIVNYTGNQTQGATFPHGLDSAPEMVIIKNKSTSTYWFVYHKDLDANKNVYLNDSSSQQADNQMFGADANVVTVGSSISVNSSTTDSMIAYCFHSVDGHQKVGSYTGTGSAGSPTITTGFQPRFVMIKNINLNQEWIMIDSVRGNNSAKTLYPNYSYAEVTSGNNIDFNPNGFTIQESGGGINYQSGNTFIYLAIA